VDRQKSFSSERWLLSFRGPIAFGMLEAIRQSNLPSSHLGARTVRNDHDLFVMFKIIGMATLDRNTRLTSNWRLGLLRWLAQDRLAVEAAGPSSVPDCTAWQREDGSRVTRPWQGMNP
jgi:hypothetical protein